MKTLNTKSEERRQQLRTDIDQTTSLSYPLLGLLQARISNISDSGIFLRLGNIRLNLYSEAEIIECINNTLNLMRAQVVRITEHGAGLRFIDPDPLQIERLRTIQTMSSAPMNKHNAI